MFIKYKVYIGENVGVIGVKYEETSRYLVVGGRKRLKNEMVSLIELFFERTNYVERASASYNKTMFVVSPCPFKNFRKGIEELKNEGFLVENVSNLGRIFI